MKITKYRSANRMQVDSTEEEATNAETDGTGVPGDNGDMSDRAGGDGAAEQPGAPEGVDREPEGVQKSEKEAGNDSNKNLSHPVNTECDADLEKMTDIQWETLWMYVQCTSVALKNFLTFSYSSEEFSANKIPKAVLEKKYSDAIALAAGLEKMLNGKKYTP